MYSCEYYSMLMTLFKTQVSATDGSSDPLTTYQRNTAQAVITQSTIQLESILRIYYLRHSFEAYDPMLIISLAHLANSILGSIEKLEQDSNSVPSETSESLLSTMILCFKGLHDQSKNAYIASLMLAVMRERLSTDVHIAVGRHVLHEPDGESEILEELTTKQSQPMISELVLPGTDLHEDPKMWRLGNLVDEARRH